MKNIYTTLISLSHLNLLFLAHFEGFEPQNATVLGIYRHSVELRSLCLEAGADDVGFVEVDRPAIADQHSDILRAFPPAKTLISFVTRMNRENIRTPVRSAANIEFHPNYDHANEVARRIARILEQTGVRSMIPGASFPMEMDQFPGKVWVVSGVVA
jgi:hypothetical protein